MQRSIIGDQRLISHHLQHHGSVGPIQARIVKKSVANEMEGYRLYNVMPALFEFIEDLTNWYIRLNRAGFWAEGTSSR